MAQICMNLLALFADMERIFMLKRVAGAREAKRKGRGKRSGPKPKITPQQRKAIAALMADEDRDVTADQVAEDFGISRATLYRNSRGPAPRYRPSGSVASRGSRGYVIDWGDRKQTPCKTGARCVGEVLQTYCYPGRYRVCAWRVEAKSPHSQSSARLNFPALRKPLLRTTPHHSPTS
ncbi:helix-turn-helix domain-containing protein [Streptomyces gobiensis]|uniref:helix-turn-helix domain-containing protein n=1 Tax=Streptomyces gobiensis TaxID=2875706 RepID=UPI001E408B85|nr:helix-turn-helix domain-containing protein [Streptomyces gobiensis]UGY90279.1 Hin recombinase [Streptomyces gobiensis]UGY94932.1 Hin recombinase [Streptomyces gobiensis]